MVLYGTVLILVDTLITITVTVTVTVIVIYRNKYCYILLEFINEF